MIMQSVWPQTLQAVQSYSSLLSPLEVDVVIIGAGITGLTSAIALQAQGKRVAVLEAHTIGSGTTGHSTANLYVPIENLYQQLAAKFSKRVASQVAQARKSAIDYIEMQVNKHAINCSFARRPWYMFTRSAPINAKISQELEALNYCGMPASYVDELPMPMQFTKAIKLEHQARFNPLQYLYGLAQVLVANGSEIYEKSPVTHYEEHKDHCEVHTAKARIKARKLIIATHIPLGFNTLQMKSYPYRTYAVAANLADNFYPNGILWDMDIPHFSISSHSLSSDKLDTLIIAGNSHKTGQASEATHRSHLQTVSTYLKNNFSGAKVTHEWSAQHYQPADGLPYMGFASRKSKHCVVATGYSADGLTYGTVAGILLADLVQARGNPWYSIFKATRFTPKASAVKFTVENSKVLCQYLSDYPGNTETQDYLSVKAGEGKVIEEQGEKWAVYRDENNQLHRVSAVCTHMKCIVKWNDAERSWDCPCHGSRFDIEGQIIEGPALKPLKRKLFSKEEG